MSEKIIVPVLGESITEATVSKWLKKEGETIEIDEPIVELETDKVNLEVPSPVSGKLKKIDFKDGSIVEVGAVLGSISESSLNDKKNDIIKKVQPTLKETQKDNVVNLETQKKEPKIFEKKNDDIEITEKPLVLTNEVEENQEAEVEEQFKNQSLSPAVRKIVAENKIDLDKIEGSGKDGRVVKGDLLSLMGVNPPPSERKIKYGQEERIKMTRLRQTIAKRLKLAQENAICL